MQPDALHSYDASLQAVKHETDSVPPLQNAAHPTYPFDTLRSVPTSVPPHVDVSVPLPPAVQVPHVAGASAALPDSMNHQGHDRKPQHLSKDCIVRSLP